MCKAIRKQECIPVGCILSAAVAVSWGVYLVPGGVPGSGGCTWSQGVYWVGDVPGLGSVPGPGGCTWSWGGVPGPGGCTW